MTEYHATSPMRDASGYLNEEQVERLLEAARQDKKNGWRNHLLLLVLYRTGRRISEVVRGNKGHGIRPMDVNYNDSVINFTILKKNKITVKRVLRAAPEEQRREYNSVKGEQRKKNFIAKLRSQLIEEGILKEKVPERVTMPVNKELMEKIKEYHLNKPVKWDDFFFPFTRRNADYLIKKAGEKAGIEVVGNRKIHCHVLRHSFAVHMAKRITNPAGIKMLKEMLQHGNMDMTLFYLSFGRNEMRQMLEEAWGKTHTP